MYKIGATILLLGVLLTATSCVQPRITITTTAGPVNYTQLIKQWSQMKNPNETFRMKVATVKEILTEKGPTEVVAVQVHFFYETKAESYILFVRKDRVLSWLYAGTPTEDEDEEESEELFPARDQA